MDTDFYHTDLIYTDFNFIIPMLLFQFCSTLRYNKLLAEIKKNDKISFREFTNMILKISDVAFPKKTPMNRMVQLLTVMEK